MRVSLAKALWGSHDFAAGVLLAALMSALGCSPSPPATSPSQPGPRADAPAPIIKEIPLPTAAQADWIWTTVGGRFRNYPETWDFLRRAMGESGARGIAVAVCQARNWLEQPETYLFHLGFTDPEEKRPFDRDTVFPAGRLADPVFGYLVLRLADLKMFDLDQPLIKQLAKPAEEYPEFAELIKDSRARILTARLVLLQRSGLANSRAGRTRPDSAFERAAGGNFGYSQEASRFLRMVIEEKTGRSLESLAKSLVFDRFSLRHMGFALDPTFEGRVAGEFEPVGEGSPKAVSAGFYSSAADYLRFMENVIMQGGGLANPYIGLPFYDTQVIIRSPSILEPPRLSGRLDLPLAFNWSLGWGVYYIPRAKVKIVGQRTGLTECLAVVYSEFPSGKMTAIVIFAIGEIRAPLAGRVLREIAGDLKPPLAWLGF